MQELIDQTSIILTLFFFLIGVLNIPREIIFKITSVWASLVAQWLGVCLPVRGTSVRALVWEDPTCRRAAGPARLEPVLRNGRGRDGERPARRDEEWPLLATTGEGPRTETKTQHSHK